MNILKSSMNARWRSRAPGGEIPLVFFRVLSLVVVWGMGSVSVSVSVAEAAAVAKKATAAQTATPTDVRRPRTLLSQAPPFVPRSSDFGIEMGLLTGDEDKLWLGGLAGWHLGICPFTQSETCQQYIDLIGGAAIRESETSGFYLLSNRWQFVNFPERHSLFVRLFGGMSQIKSIRENSWQPVVGVGIGVTTYLHEKVDLRVEARSGWNDRFFAQALLGVQFKTDRLLEVFARRLKQLGVGTVDTVIEATGTAIKATGEGLEGVVEGVSSPFRKSEKSSPAPTPAK
jgi:hypothetical protein